MARSCRSNMRSVAAASRRSAVAAARSLRLRCSMPSRSVSSRRFAGRAIAMYPAAGPLAPNQFTGALDNSGETIVLYAASGLEIFRFTYSDNLSSTDGGGKSLVRVLSSTNPNPLAYPWRESTQDGGNPGSTKRTELPAITVEEAEALVEDIVTLTEARGYRRARKPASKNKNAKGNEPAGLVDAPSSIDQWGHLQANIIAGRALHDSIRDLAIRLVMSGMSGGAAVNMLRGLMEQSEARHNERWQARYGDIPRAVSSAERLPREKRGTGADTAAWCRPIRTGTGGTEGTACRR